MTALATVGFWAGIIVAIAALSHWGPGVWRRVGPDMRLWVLGAACTLVVVGVVGGLWAAGQMSSGTPYP